MKEYTLHKIRGEEYYNFGIENKQQCAGCKYFEKCISKLKSNHKKHFRIKKKMIDNWEIIEKNREKIESVQGRMLYSKRMGLIEKVFGHIKNNLVLFFVGKQIFRNMLCNNLMGEQPPHRAHACPALKSFSAGLGYLRTFTLLNRVKTIIL